MILRAQTASSAELTGWHAKILRRLGVSPGPVTLYGPTIFTASTRGTPCVSTASKGESSGCSFCGSSASLFAIKVTPISRGPALTGTRTCNWASKSDANLEFSRSWNELTNCWGVPTVTKWTRAPSTDISTWCSASSPRTRPALLRQSVALITYSPSAGNVW